MPKLILILSGKRKSGKDFIAEHLHNVIGPEHSVIIRLSGPLKSQYAKEHGLDYNRLLDATEYKEKYRKDMICWSDSIRKTDPGYFCRAAIEQSSAESKPLWIVSDARRETDLQYFVSNYPDITKTVRIIASQAVRKERGWVFTKGIDDAISECGLDNISHWNYVIRNDDDRQLNEDLTHLKRLIISQSISNET